MKELKNIFEGNNNAYGQMIIQPGAITDKGKQKAKAFIKRDTVTDKLWQDHLKGVEPALGIIPINENNLTEFLS